MQYVDVAGGRYIVLSSVLEAVGVEMNKETSENLSDAKRRFFKLVAGQGGEIESD